MNLRSHRGREVFHVQSVAKAETAKLCAYAESVLERVLLVSFLGSDERLFPFRHKCGGGSLDVAGSKAVDHVRQDLLELWRRGWLNRRLRRRP